MKTLSCPQGLHVARMSLHVGTKARMPTLLQGGEYFHFSVLEMKTRQVGLQKCANRNSTLQGPSPSGYLNVFYTLSYCYLVVVLLLF